MIAASLWLMTELVLLCHYVPVIKLGSECLRCWQSGLSLSSRRSVCGRLQQLPQDNHILQHGLQWIIFLTHVLRINTQPYSVSSTPRKHQPLLCKNVNSVHNSVPLSVSPKSGVDESLTVPIVAELSSQSPTVTAEQWRQAPRLTPGPRQHTGADTNRFNKLIRPSHTVHNCTKSMPRNSFKAVLMISVTFCNQWN